MSLNIREDDLRMAGEKIGFERGIRKGRRDDIAAESYQAKRETAKLMAERKYPLSEIRLMTGLSEAEIKNYNGISRKTGIAYQISGKLNQHSLMHK